MYAFTSHVITVSHKRNVTFFKNTKKHMHSYFVEPDLDSSFGLKPSSKSILYVF